MPTTPPNPAQPGPGDLPGGRTVMALLRGPDGNTHAISLRSLLDSGTLPDGTPVPQYLLDRLRPLLNPGPDAEGVLAEGTFEVPASQPEPPAVTPAMLASLGQMVGSDPQRLTDAAAEIVHGDPSGLGEDEDAMLRHALVDGVDPADPNGIERTMLLLLKGLDNSGSALVTAVQAAADAHQAAFDRTAPSMDATRRDLAFTAMQTEHEVHRVTEVTLRRAANVASEAMKLVVEVDQTLARYVTDMHDRLRRLEKMVTLSAAHSGFLDGITADLRSTGDDDIADRIDGTLDTIRSSDNAVARVLKQTAPTQQSTQSTTGETTSTAADAPHDGAH